jgi:non-lysosomal glucosylceramidase
MGCVLKVYREWRLGAGDAWLRTLWPEVRRALEYAWVSWDADGDGVMEGEQHNTYDVEFCGPNTMMGTLYLAALLAAAKMAKYLGEDAVAERYQRLFALGSSLLDKLLWNGEYYIQKIDETHLRADRNQYGEGCLSDQLLGQWFAEVVDLGKLLPHGHIQAALRSIFRHNFAQNFHYHPNTRRLFALSDEKGLLVCTWPNGKRPTQAFRYSDEVWTGIEYQVAAHLVCEEMVKEGVAIVEAVRDRYDGARRNPWDEVECGHHYARAMSSWSLLSAFSGFSYSAPAQEMRFAPRVNKTHFRCLFSTGTAWGGYSQRVTGGELRAEISVEGGKLELAVLRLPRHRASVKLSSPLRAAAKVEGDQTVIRFAAPVTLEKGEKLTLSLG